MTVDRFETSVCQIGCVFQSGQPHVLRACDRWGTEMELSHHWKIDLSSAYTWS